RVLKVAHPPGVLLLIAPGDLSAAVRGAVVHQEQLPVDVVLREDALDGLLDEPRGVQEDDDGGDEWPVHPRHPRPHFGQGGARAYFSHSTTTRPSGYEGVTRTL